MRQEGDDSRGIISTQQAASGHLATRNRRKINPQILLAIFGLMVSFASLIFFHRNESLNNVFRLFAQGLFEIIFASLAAYIIYQSNWSRNRNRNSKKNSHLARSALSELPIVQGHDQPNTASSTIEVRMRAALSEAEHNKNSRVLAALRQALLTDRDTISPQQIDITKQKLLALRRQAISAFHDAIKKRVNFYLATRWLLQQTALVAIQRPAFKSKRRWLIFSKTIPEEILREAVQRRSVLDNTLPLLLQDYNMHQLVIAYNDPTTSPSRKKQLERIILGIIERFAQTKIWTPDLLESVVPLGACANPIIGKALLEVCLRRLDKSILSNTNLTVMIGQLIRFANHRLEGDEFKRVLTGDDLLQVLTIIKKQIDKQITDGNEDNLVALLRPLTELLNAMVDQNVQLSAENTNVKAIADCLRELQNNITAPDAAYYAAYAYQAFIRLPEKQGPLQQYFGCSYKVIKGAVTVLSSAWQMDPFALVDGIRELKDDIGEAAATVKGTRHQGWYNSMRVVEACIPSNSGEILRLNQLLTSNKLRPDKKLAYGIIRRLLPLLTSDDLQLRYQTYQWLRQLLGLGALQPFESNKLSRLLKFLLSVRRSRQPENVERWQSDRLIQQRVLQVIQSEPVRQRVKKTVMFVEVPDEDAQLCLENRYHQHLEKALIVASSSTSKAQNRAVIGSPSNQMQASSSSPAESSGSESSAKSSELVAVATSPNTLPKELITQAFYRLFPVDYRIEQLWMQVQQYLNSPGVSKELACYVPLQVVENFTDLDYENAQRFDLDQKIQSFLGDNRSKLLLIHGHSGCGKSLFGSYILRELWKRRVFGKSIPLYIPLGEIGDPGERLVEKALGQMGFTEAEIQALKIQCQSGERELILYLDGFNEMSSYQNLYIRNKLREWNAKVIVTCQLGQLPRNYKGLFSVGDGSPLQECFIAPFNQQQIDNYLTLTTQAKYAEIKDEKLKAKEIDAELKERKTMLASLHTISELIQCPFFLKLVLEILSELKRKQNNNIGTPITRSDVFEAFLEYWYKREEPIIRKARGASLSKSFEYRDSFVNFGQELAWEMLKKNQFIIQVEPNVFRTIEDTSENPWQRYFTEQIPMIAAAREGVPLKRMGNSVEFIHKSIGHYYIACRLKKELDELRDGKKSLNETLYFNQVKLTGIIPVMEILRELIQNDQGCTNVLYNMMLYSKDHPNAVPMSSNAASLWVAYLRKPMTALELNGVKLDGSNLNGVVADHTSGKNVSFKRVKVARGWLRDANFEGAELDVDFGERPCLEHKEIVRRVRFKPTDGFTPTDDQLAVASGSSIFLWQPEKQVLQGMLAGVHKKDVTCMAYSSNGRLLISGDNEGKLCIWNPQTQSVANQLNVHTAGPVTSLAFHPKENKFLSGHNGSLILWDVESGKSVDTFTIVGNITSAAFDCTGDMFAWSSHIGRTIHLLKRGTREPTLLNGHNGAVYALAFHPTTPTLASAGDDKTVILWDVMTGGKHILKDPTEWVLCLGFSKNGELLAAGSWDNMVYVWEVKTRSLQRVYSTHTLPVFDLSFNFNSDLIASAGGDGNVQLWDAKSDQILSQEPGHTKGVRSVAVRPQGGRVVSTGIDKKVCVWDPESGRSLRVFKDHHQNEVRCAAFGEDWILATVSNDRTLRFWNLATFQSVHTVEKAHDRDITCVAYSPKGIFATGSWDNTIRFWSANGEKIRVLEGHNAGIFNVAFSPDGNTLISVHYDETIVEWDVDTGKIRKRIKEHTSSVRGVAFCPDSKGDIYATASYDKSIRVWSLREGRCIRIFKLAAPDSLEPFECVVFSPDGSMIAGGDSSTVRIWYTQTGAVVAVLRGFQGPVNSLAWDKVGLFAGGSNSAVTCWRPVELSPNNIKWLLMWTTYARSIIAERCQLKDASGLTPLNTKLLVQRGAVGVEHFARDVLPEKPTLPVVPAASQTSVGEQRQISLPAAAVSPDIPPDDVILSSAYIILLLEAKRLTVFIDTTRLHMESVSPLNYIDFIKLLGSEENMKTYANGVTWNAGFIKNRFNVWVTARWFNNDPFSAFAIYKRDTHEFIGYILLGHLGDNAHAELVYIIDKQYWHRGYGKEAAAAIMRKYAPTVMTANYKLVGNECIGVKATALIGFDESEAKDKDPSKYKADNPASPNILKKCGFRKIDEKEQFGAMRGIFLAAKKDMLQGFVDDTVKCTNPAELTLGGRPQL